MFFNKRNKESKRNKNALVDNHDKICYPINQRGEDYGYTLAASCSLCGGYISLFPKTDTVCSKCYATIVHKC